MDFLLTWFILFLLLSIGIIYSIVISFKEKKFVLRDVSAGIVTLVISSIFTVTVLSYMRLNSKLVDGNIIVNEEKLSYINYQDSIINDSLLYDMIKSLRVPHAKIVFAQAKLETGDYKSELFRSNYNLFGMKLATIRPTITTMHNYGYQKYHNWKESVVDYLIWQLTNNVSRVNDDVYFEYLSDVYAEDPNYVTKLKKIISKTNFAKWE